MHTIETESYRIDVPDPGVPCLRIFNLEPRDGRSILLRTHKEQEALQALRLAPGSSVDLYCWTIHVEVLPRVDEPMVVR